MTAYICPATGCAVAVEERLILCTAHWTQVPRKLRALLWLLQPLDREGGRDLISDEFLTALQQAIEAIDAKAREAIHA